MSPVLLRVYALVMGLVTGLARGPAVALVCVLVRSVIMLSDPPTLLLLQVLSLLHQSGTNQAHHTMAWSIEDTLGQSTYSAVLKDQTMPARKFDSAKQWSQVMEPMQVMVRGRWIW